VKEQEIEEITDIIVELKKRYTPANFKKMGIKVGKVLTFSFEGSPVILEIIEIKNGKYFAKHIELHEPNTVAGHYRHHVNASDEAVKTHGSPYCVDCELPVSKPATVQGKLKYETRKERYLNDGTPIDATDE